VFVCTFQTSRGEERAWIRAWSAEQAAAAVRELVGDDVEGVIRVERPRALAW
jgi:hypothetical protein